MLMLSASIGVNSQEGRTLACESVMASFLDIFSISRRLAAIAALKSSSSSSWTGTDLGIGAVCLLDSSILSSIARLRSASKVSSGGPIEYGTVVGYCLLGCFL